MPIPKQLSYLAEFEKRAGMSNFWQGNFSRKWSKAGPIYVLWPWPSEPTIMSLGLCVNVLGIIAPLPTAQWGNIFLRLATRVRWDASSKGFMWRGRGDNTLSSTLWVDGTIFRKALSKSSRITLIFFRSIASFWLDS